MKNLDLDLNLDLDNALKRKKQKNAAALIIFALLLIIGLIVSCCMGTADIKPADVIRVIANRAFSCNYDIGDNISAIIWDIRLPRILCACFVGAGLAVGGVIFQSILENPLADPYTLGISTGASFGASLALLLNILYGVYFPTAAAALAGALVTLVAVIKIASRGSGLESSNLIIAGIIVSSVLSSAVSFIKMLAGESVGVIVFWIMGSLSGVGWQEVLLTAPVVAVCIFAAFLFSGELDIIALGEAQAGSIGVNTGLIRLVCLVIGSLITAVCVAVCGVIGFVGLIVPHLLRYGITSGNRALIPLSALLGAALLLYADSITRIFSAGEIPVGVLTTLIGGPFFIFVFTRREGRTDG